MKILAIFVYWVYTICMKTFHRIIACILLIVSFVFVGCGNRKDPITQDGVSNSEGAVNGGEEVEVKDPILGKWKLIDLVENVDGNEHIIAKTLSSKKSGSADYFALSSWFVIQVYEQGVLECSSSSAIIKPYLEQNGKEGTWELCESGYKIFADGLLNSGVIPKSKNGYMVGVIEDNILTCSGESEDGVVFTATLRYAGDV